MLARRLGRREIESGVEGVDRPVDLGARHEEGDPYRGR
jgi:hypothetical protein